MTKAFVVDLRKDVSDFEEYVRQRVEGHVTAAAESTNPKPVKRIDFGFEFGQSNWVVLVFDTRENAEPDGEWTRNLNRKPSILLERPNWPIAFDLPEDARIYFIDLGGKEVDVTEAPDNLSCNIIGETLKHVLITARERDVFRPLHRAERCELGVENLEGYYGWPRYEDRGHENLL